MSAGKKLQIRNSTAEFLIFTSQAGAGAIEVRVEEDTVWLTQKLMAALFEVTVPTINEHLANLYAAGRNCGRGNYSEFPNSSKRGPPFGGVASMEFHNLDAIIAVGFRVNSARAIQFRQWATGVLRDFAIRGYVLDKERLKNGAFFSKEYFENLLAEIREIRASERRFYQKITDIYATAMDYSPEAETTQTFFATVQNKLHFAIHGRTAAELIVERADSKKERMGLTTWKNAPHGKILKPDVVRREELPHRKGTEVAGPLRDDVSRLCRGPGGAEYPHDDEAIGPAKLNAFLQFNERDILDHPGKVSQEVAKAFAESEFEKYRIVQDRLFESDFDRHIKKALEGGAT